MIINGNKGEKGKMKKLLVFIVCAFLSVMAYADIYSADGSLMGSVSGNNFYGRSGSSIGSIDDSGNLYGTSGGRIGCIDDSGNIYGSYGYAIGNVSGSSIYGSDGSQIGSISSNTIYGLDGTVYATFSGMSKRDVIIFFFFFKK